MGRKRKRRQPTVHPGASPGTIHAERHQLKPTIDLTVYSPSKLRTRTGVSVGDLPAIDKDKDIAWINVVGLGDIDIIQSLANRFGIHRLAIEDVVNTPQRPKFEEYDDYLFLVLRLPHFDDANLEVEQISLLVGHGFVLTFQEIPGDSFDPIRKRLENPRSYVRNHGADFLGYGLLDSVVDSVFPIVAQYTDELDAIDDKVKSDRDTKATLHRLHELRSDIQGLRRDALSLRDMVRRLSRYEGHLIQRETLIHLRDVDDHSHRLVEFLDSCRDSCTQLYDLQIAMASLRMNEVMKVLTVISTIFIPLGFITGLYGMNFSNEESPWNMPETRWYYGYPFAILLMLGLSLFLLAYFFRKGWFERND